MANPTAATFLAFPSGGAEAVRFYVGLFPNAKLESLAISRGGPIPKGKLLSATFPIGDQPVFAMDGGERFAFALGISIFISVDGQKEIDRLWAKLSTGGTPSQCGWIQDRWGVWWQIVPRQIGTWLNDEAHGDTGAALQAMMTMG